MMKRPTKTDVAIAKDALLVSASLSGAAKTVGGILLKHFNLRTGQCDPSITRLSNLAGVDRSTVFRALSELVQHDIFSRDVHGGYGGRNQYWPNWSRCRGIVGGYETRAKELKFERLRGVEVVEDLQPSQPQDCHPDGGADATQTLSVNTIDTTLGDHPNSEESIESKKSSEQKNVESGLLQKQSQGGDNRKGGRANTSRGTAQAEAAKRRLDHEIRTKYPEFYEKDYVNISDELYAEAIELERAKEGHGVHLLVDRFSRSTK